MALEPSAVATGHVDEELAQIAIAKAVAALDGLGRVKAQDDKEYLTAKVERWQKWAETARKQQEKRQ